MDHDTLLDALRRKFGTEFRATERGGRETIIEWLTTLDSELSYEGLRAAVAELERGGHLRYRPPSDLPSGDQITLEAARYGHAVLPESAEGMWQIGRATRG